MNRGNLPRVLVISIILVVLSIFSVSTQAAPSSESVIKWQSTNLTNFAQITYPESFRLSSKKCQIVPFQYEIDDELDTNNAVFVVQILNIKKKILYGESAWWGKMTSPRIAESLPLVGRIEVQVCKKKWSKEDRNYSAVRAKSYDLYFSYGRYELDGSMAKKSETMLRMRFKK